MKSLRLRGCALYDLGTQVTTANQLIAPLRCTVVLDRQPSGGSIPTFDTVFGITNQSGTESSTVWAPLRYDATDRFKVLKDWIIEIDYNSLPLGAGGTGENAQINLFFDEYIKLGNIETLFGGQSAPMTIADVQSGALYIYFRSSISGFDTQWSITADSFARLRYTD